MFRGAIVLLGLIAGQLAAQPPKLPQKVNDPPQFVKFNFDGNPEQMLAEFLKAKAGRDWFQEILKKFDNQSPENLQNLKNLLPKDGGNTEAIGKIIDEILKKHPGVKQGNPLEIDAASKELMDKFNLNKDLVEKLMKGLDKKLGPDGMPKINDLVPPDSLDELPDLKLPEVNDWIDQDFAFDDRIGEWLSDLLKNENFQREMGEFFKDAPGLRDAFGDLANSLKAPDANGNWLPKVPDFGGGKWNFDFKPPKLPFELGQLPKLPSLKMPQLPRLNVPMPRFGNLGLPRIPGFGRVPNVNMPAAPSVSGGREWAYILLVIVAGGLAWWFLRSVKLSPRAPKSQIAAILRALPASITTRTQLKTAFDTLAIMRFGDQARPWNHRLIARHLGDAAPMTDAAQAFASLYEIARYTPGDDRLSRAEQDAVRDSLAVLTAGVA